MAYRESRVSQLNALVALLAPGQSVCSLFTGNTASRSTIPGSTYTFSVLYTFSNTNKLLDIVKEAIQTQIQEERLVYDSTSEIIVHSRPQLTRHFSTPETDRVKNKILMSQVFMLQYPYLSDLFQGMSQNLTGRDIALGTTRYRRQEKDDDDDV
jgi:hypothetical protein